MLVTIRRDGRNKKNPMLYRAQERANLFSVRLVEGINLGLGDDAFNGREIIFFLATLHLSHFTQPSCSKLSEKVKQMPFHIGAIIFYL